jgi:thiamine pyrophosphate-dependent acetolactate synthase large subunit-like protein
VVDLFGTVNAYRDRIVRDSRPLMKPGAKLISISAADLLMHSNFQDFQRYQAADLAISGDGEATLPILVEAVKRTMPSSGAFADRGNKLREAADAAHNSLLQNATYAWDATPISVARLVATLGQEIKNEDWALVSAQEFQSNWPLKLWNFDKHYQHIGGAGGYGVGYTGPSSIGAALAHRDAGGRFAVSIMGDGELMCCPGTFWTAAHHKIPILMIMHNNRAYHQEVMHIQRMADRHGRGIDNIGIGTRLGNPDIDFAKMADSMGVWSKGPITDPADLAPAIRQAVAMVKQGQPALVDVVAQAR